MIPLLLVATAALARPPGEVQGADHIPKGHLPPVGLCRHWLPGTPPGHQPPPMSCADAFYSWPPGAQVVERRTELLAIVHTPTPRPATGPRSRPR
jgi:hypothetical protein